MAIQLKLLQKVKKKVFEYCPREYIEGGFYQPFLGFTAGIIRMRVLFAGGPYMRKNGMSNLVFFIRVIFIAAKAFNF